MKERSRARQKTDGNEPACIVARNQEPYEGHQGHDCESAWRERHPCALRRVPEQCLQILRNQHGASEERKTEHDHHHKRNGKIAVLEHSHVDHGILLEVLPDDGSDNSDRSDHGEGENEVGLQPVVTLSFVENDLQTAKADAD